MSGTESVNKAHLENLKSRLLQDSQKPQSAFRNSETMQLMNIAGNQAMLNLLNINASGNGDLNTIQRKKDGSGNTGLPSAIRSRIEAMSGMDMSGVKVHYNSSKPAGIGALAYTQGNNIDVAPNQEKNLPHEAWHVVQQKRGVVSPNTQVNGLSVNDDDSLEHEADVMGEKSMQAGNNYSSNISKVMNNRPSQSNIVQMCHSDSDEDEDDDADDEEEEEDEAPQEEKDDPSFVLPSEKSKDRHTFSDKLRKQVIGDTAPRNKDGLYVCQGCGHPLAEGDLTEIKTWYDSKSDKRHDRKSADLDHVPPWSIRHDKLVAKGAKEEDIRKEHDDPKKLRALCYRCNQSHAFEGRPLPSVDRSGEEYESSDEERDKKIWKRYRRKGRSSRSRSPRRRKSKSRSRSRSSRSSSSSRSRSPRRSKKDK
jgi:hypothetical protein